MLLDVSNSRRSSRRFLMAKFSKGNKVVHPSSTLSKRDKLPTKLTYPHTKAPLKMISLFPRVGYVCSLEDTVSNRVGPHPKGRRLGTLLPASRNAATASPGKNTKGPMSGSIDVDRSMARKTRRKIPTKIKVVSMLLPLSNGIHIYRTKKLTMTVKHECKPWLRNTHPPWNFIFRYCWVKFRKKNSPQSWQSKQGYRG